MTDGTPNSLHRHEIHVVATVGGGLAIKDALTVVASVRQLFRSEAYGVEKTFSLRVVLNVGRGNSRASE